MSILLKSLGGLFLLAGIGWAAYIIVAVATHMEGFTTLRQILPWLILHAGALFSGMVLVGLGQRVNKPSPAA